MKYIVHIVFGDKFTDGYINFMRNIMNNIQHKFIIKTNEFLLSSAGDDIIIIKNYNELAINDMLKKSIFQCDKIIVSGFFTGEKMLVRLPKYVMKKMYIQLWGGDFYPYKEGINLFHIRSFVKYVLKRICLIRCAGIITLVQNDYDEVKRIFRINKKHFIAPMPSDPSKQINFEKLRSKQNKTKNIRIIVGNSATESNHHQEVIDLLTNFKDDDFIVIVPLSYGDDDYKNQIINYGHLKLNNKFIPITEYVDKDEYLELLSSCDIGIFNNDRQQGMGNISSLLQLGRKVFIREGTTMWNHYKSMGAIIHNITEIETTKPLSSICLLSSDEIRQNINTIERIRSMDNLKKKWQVVFDDN